MSGTSCDGLDIANCIFWEENGSWNYEIKNVGSIGYNYNLRNKLLDCYNMSGYDLKKLDIELGEFILEKVDLHLVTSIYRINVTL